VERTRQADGTPTQESEIARDRIYSIVASALSLAGGIVFGYFLFEKTRSARSIPIPVAIIGGALLLLGMLLLSRWWIRANRSIASGAPISTQLKTERGFYLCVALIAAVGFDYIAYDLSHNRIVEALTALIISVPIGLFVLPIAFRLSRPFAAFATTAWKTGIGLQVVMFVTFAISLVVNLLPTKHTYPGSEPLHEFNIAMGFMWLALAPFSARLLRKRYREAVAFQASAPPDRWQAYKNKLASNE
jgi:hypothetical protein